MGLSVSNFDESTGEFEMNVHCGGGAYVRTLIVDLARAVGTCAHMTALVRTVAGPFRLSTEQVAEQAEPKTWPVEAVCEDRFEDAPYILEALTKAEDVLALSEAQAVSEVV